MKCFMCNKDKPEVYIGDKTLGYDVCDYCQLVVSEFILDYRRKSIALQELLQGKGDNK